MVSMVTHSSAKQGVIQPTVFEAASPSDPRSLAEKKNAATRGDKHSTRSDHTAEICFGHRSEHWLLYFNKDTKTHFEFDFQSKVLN